MNALTRLIAPVMIAAREAGKKILDIYHSDFSVQTKADHSPVTAADLASHAILVRHLSAFEHKYPVLSEEDDHLNFAERSAWPRYWLVDPLDGTREFVHKRDNFCINIGMVENHTVIFGMVYVPVQQRCYYATAGGGAFVVQGDAAPQPIRVAAWHEDRPMRVAVSRSHPSGLLQRFLDEFREYESVQLGSAMKMCMVAEGRVDFYPRFGPTWEWDTAAAQCIVEEAGGRLTDLNFNALRYNAKESLLNPPFLVFGDIGSNGRQAVEMALPDSPD